MSCNELEDIITKFDSFTHKPAKFLTVQEDAKDGIKNLVKSLYDFTKSQDKPAKKSKTKALPELIVNDFDEEQIWQQIELQNTECWDNIVWDVANSITSKTDLEFPVKLQDESFEESDPAESENDENSPSEAEEEVEKPVRNKEPKQKKKGKSSIVDDQFFKLQDMEKFLLNEEKKDGKQTVESDEESIDMFDEIDSEGSEEDEDGKEMMYSGFFDNENEDQENSNDDEEQESGTEEAPRKKSSQKEKRVTFADAASESDSNDSEDQMSVDDNQKSDKPKNVAEAQLEEKKSEFQRRQERLREQIERLEGKTLSDAPWQLKGEVDATKRPANSLLQEVVDFDLTTRPPPIITEQTTLTLEDIIKQRVKDKAWDDVEKKEKPVNDVLSFKKAEILDHAKSKQSLAEVYEAEYLKQKHATSNDNDNEKEPESHKEIREAMANLFAKLDALSHYHYTPKPAQPEVKIISNTPAITIEEVAPVIASNASLLAPEEVKSKRSGELMSKDERTDTDKKRERRKKKKFQKEKGKVAKVTEQRNTSKAPVANDKSLKTSKAFFQQLNDDTTSAIKANSAKRKNVKNKGQ